jgi:hypothetical protein
MGRFRFVDDLTMQRKIARRVMITMEGQKKVNENCIVQIKIMYSDHARAFYSEPFYMGNGKVNSVTFLPSGKLNVEVDIGVVSAKDYKTK